MSAFQWLTYDVEWRIALFLFILYVSSEIAQGIYQDSNRAVLHALGTCNGMLARCSRKISGHKAHGSTGSLDVDDIRHIAQCRNDDFCIIAIAQVVRLQLASRHGIDYQCTVADTLGSWQVDTCIELAWSLDCIFHFLLVSIFKYSSSFFYFSAFSIRMSLMLTAFSLAYRIGRSSSVSGISSHARVLGRIFFGPGIRGE